MNFKWTCFVINIISLFDVSLPLVVSGFDDLEKYYSLRKEYIKKGENEEIDPVLQFTDEQKEKLCKDVLENWHFGSISNAKYVRKNDYNTFQEIKALPDETYFKMHYKEVKGSGMSRLNTVSYSDTDDGYTTSGGTNGGSDTEGSVTSGRNSDKAYGDNNDEKLGKDFHERSPSSPVKKMFRKLSLKKRRSSTINGSSNKGVLNENAQGITSSDYSCTDSDDSMTLMAKDTNLITDSDGRQYKAVYPYESFFLRINNESLTPQLVFSCLAKKKFTKKLVHYYISYGYVENEWFLYGIHASSDHLMLLALIEPSPTVTDFEGSKKKLEEYYIEQKTNAAQNNSLKQTGDQVCDVTDPEKTRICSLVFSSDPYVDKWQFTKPVNTVRFKCETQQIFFEEVNVGTSKIFADMMECKVKQLGSKSVYKSFYVTKDPADKNSVFLLKSDSKYRTLDAHITDLSVLVERSEKSYTIPSHYGPVSGDGRQDNSLLGSVYDYARTIKNSIL